MLQFVSIKAVHLADKSVVAQNQVEMDLISNNSTRDLGQTSWVAAHSANFEGLKPDILSGSTLCKLGTSEASILKRV